jgi:hypothetical protein
MLSYFAVWLINPYMRMEFLRSSFRARKTGASAQADCLTINTQSV